MKKLEELIPLEKQSTVDLHYCNILFDEQDEIENTRARIVEQDGRLFYHEMQDGETVRCFEVAESWRPFPDVVVYCYTPDDKHIHEIDSRFLFAHDALRMDEDLVEAGMTCRYKGHVAEFMDDEHISMDGAALPCIERSSEFVYKLMKRKILAMDGARGLYCFLDQIAERSNMGELPVLSGAWDALLEKYT